MDNKSNSSKKTGKQGMGSSLMLQILMKENDVDETQIVKTLLSFKHLPRNVEQIQDITVPQLRYEMQ